MSSVEVTSVVEFPEEQERIQDVAQESTGESEVRKYDLKPYKSFDKMNLPHTLLRGIYGYGFESPSDIQSLGIVPIKEGFDVLAQAQSGTGKTGTFTIGALSRIDPSLPQVQALILAPVRELAQQIAYVAKQLSSHTKVKVYAATGGTPCREDIAAIKNGAQLIVGTPGRIYDLMSRGALSRQNMRILILDEADQLLADRFKDQFIEIMKLGFPETMRVALFSATMPPNVVEFTESFLQDPVRILIPKEEVTLAGIKQYFVDCRKEDWKFEVLCDIYQQLNINTAIVYCNSRKRAEWLAQKMKENRFTLECIHGEMDVVERKKRMDDFRMGHVRVLISTDMLARGIDVQQVSLVINYEMPVQRENYIHRIGRCGRYGKKGMAINLVIEDELRAMEEIQNYYATTIVPLPEDLSTLSGSV